MKRQREDVSHALWEQVKKDLKTIVTLEVERQCCNQNEHTATGRIAEKLVRPLLRRPLTFAESNLASFADNVLQTVSQRKLEEAISTALENIDPLRDLRRRKIYHDSLRKQQYYSQNPYF